MRPVIAVVLFVILGLFSLPLVNQHATTPCNALESMATREGEGFYVRRGARRELAGGADFGQMLHETAASQGLPAVPIPSLPEFTLGITCTLVYWKAFANPDGLRNDLIGLRW